MIYIERMCEVLCVGEVLFGRLVYTAVRPFDGFWSDDYEKGKGLMIQWLLQMPHLPNVGYYSVPDGLVGPCRTKARCLDRLSFVLRQTVVITKKRQQQRQRWKVTVEHSRKEVWFLLGARMLARYDGYSLWIADDLDGTQYVCEDFGDTVAILKSHITKATNGLVELDLV